MQNRRVFGHIKSMLKFDFPFVNNIYTFPTGSYADEASEESWGNNSASIDLSPKFGWRCLKSTGTNSFIYSSNQSGIFSLTTGKPYEFECFVKPADSNAGKIIFLMNGSNEALSIGRNSSRQISVTCSAWGGVWNNIYNSRVWGLAPFTRQVRKR